MVFKGEVIRYVMLKGKSACVCRGIRCLSNFDAFSKGAPTEGSPILYHYMESIL